MGTIVIPCYNEAKRFPADVFLAFSGQHPEIRFLLVNDGSKDDTLALLRQMQAGREDRISVLDQPVNGGKGEAVRRGVLAALDHPASSYVGFWDADMATPLDAISSLTGQLEQDRALAMVFGARVKLLGRRIERQAVRHYLGRVFATVVSLLLGLPIYDTQCGAKIFRATPETRVLFEEPFCSRWVFDVEILARFIRHRRYDREAVKQAIFEFPLQEWRDVAGSKLRPGDFLRAFVDVLRIHLKYRSHS